MVNRYRNVKNVMKLFFKVNWTKTIYFNFKKLPFSIAKELPVFFYGKVKFQDISGEIIINSPIRRGMIGFGQPYEMNTMHKGIAEIMLAGKMICNGDVQFGKDYFIYVEKNAILEMGNMSSIASNGKIICTNSIVFGNYARIGSESQVIDTNFHPMIDTVTNQCFKMTAPIIIGNYNFISNRVTILPKTVTPNFCTIASNSLCTKDYTSLGENILIGGIPAKLLKINVSRDWDGERENMNIWLKINVFS